MVGLAKLVRSARHADVNPVGPGNLQTVYTAATDQFVRGQLYAETVMMQETLHFSGVDRGLETQIIEFQSRMKRQAAYFYDQIINGSYGYISAIAGGYHMCALASVTIKVTAGEIELAATNDKARSSATSAYAMLSDQAYSQSVATATLATKAASLDHSLAQYVTSYREALKQVESDLTAAAKKTLEDIDALRKAINQNIADIVAGGQEIGGGVANLVVGMLTEITKLTVAPDPKKDDPDSKKDEPEPKKDEADAKKDGPVLKASANDDTFAVLAIKAVASGASKLSQAEKDLNANNEKLAAAYQKLAQDEAVLAVAKAVEVQNDLFAAMVPLSATASQDISISYLSVEANLNGFSASIASVTDAAAASALAKQALRAEPLWDALNSELQEMKKMIIA